MINKKVFEDDLISGMQRELAKKDIKQGMNDLSKAVDYLHSAMDILEDNGMSSKANQILKVLYKIANPDFDRNVMKVPSMKELMNQGLSKYDLHNYTKNEASRAKFNKVLYEMGFTPNQIASYLGKDQFMTLEEVNELYQDPSFNINRLVTDTLRDQEPTPKEFNISSLANLHDPHIKGLTSDKMIKNLKEHGTVFNMADDNASDDLLNADLNDNLLEVTDQDLDPSEMDFEDEI